jgi:hypothetical protein
MYLKSWCTYSTYKWKPNLSTAVGIRSASTREVLVDSIITLVCEEQLSC